MDAGQFAVLGGLRSSAFPHRGVDGSYEMSRKHHSGWKMSCAKAFFLISFSVSIRRRVSPDRAAHSDLEPAASRSCSGMVLDSDGPLFFVDRSPICQRGFLSSSAQLPGLGLNCRRRPARTTRDHHRRRRIRSRAPAISPAVPKPVASSQRERDKASRSQSAGESRRHFGMLPDGKQRSLRRQ